MAEHRRQGAWGLVVEHRRLARDAPSCPTAGGRPAFNASRRHDRRPHQEQKRVPRVREGATRARGPSCEFPLVDHRPCRPCDEGWPHELGPHFSRIRCLQKELSSAIQLPAREIPPLTVVLPIKF